MSVAVRTRIARCPAAPTLPLETDDQHLPGYLAPLPPDTRIAPRPPRCYEVLRIRPPSSIGRSIPWFVKSQILTIFTRSLGKLSPYQLFFGRLLCGFINWKIEHFQTLTECPMCTSNLSEAETSGRRTHILFCGSRIRRKYHRLQQQELLWQLISTYYNCGRILPLFLHAHNHSRWRHTHSQPSFTAPKVAYTPTVQPPNRLSNKECRLWHPFRATLPGTSNARRPRSDRKRHRAEPPSRSLSADDSYMSSSGDERSTARPAKTAKLRHRKPLKKMSPAEYVAQFDKYREDLEARIKELEASHRRHDIEKHAGRNPAQRLLVCIPCLPGTPLSNVSVFTTSTKRSVSHYPFVSPLKCLRRSSALSRNQ